jgi:hypothetical protein
MQAQFEYYENNSCLRSKYVDYRAISFKNRHKTRLKWQCRPTRAPTLSQQEHRTDEYLSFAQGIAIVRGLQFAV